MAKKRSGFRIILTVAAVAVILAAIAALILILTSAPSDEPADTSQNVQTPPEPQTVSVHTVDVGQAQSILVRSPFGNVLIDAGTNDSESDLAVYLKSLDVGIIDYLICTHPHSDHIGGADMIVRDFDVKTVLMTDEISTDYCFERLMDQIEIKNTPAEIASAGDVYTLGDLSFAVLSPQYEADFEDANSMSLVIKLTYGSTSFLFMGDAEEDAETIMLESLDKSILDCDYLAVGHHGSNTSSSADFLNAVTPEIAVISCGRNNSYGHPRGEVIDRLAESGCNTVLRTDLVGNITVSSDGNGLSITSPEDMSA